MTLQSKQLGMMGENLATELLKQKKLRILKRNLRTKYGEIDILAQDGQTLAIVEVKTKTTSHLGAAIEMITPAKQRKLILLALELQSTYKVSNVRIDVVSVDQAKEKPILKYYKGVIEYHGR